MWKTQEQIVSQILFFLFSVWVDRARVFFLSSSSLTLKNPVCVLAVTCSKWIGDASLPPTSCPLAAHSFFQSQFIHLRNWHPGSFLAASITWHLSCRCPIDCPAPGLICIKGLTATASWRGYKKTPGFVTAGAWGRTAGATTAMLSFEELVSLTSEWKRIMCLHGLFVWKESKGKKVLHKHSNADVWRFCSLASCPRDTRVTSHLSCALLSNKLPEPLCFQSWLKEQLLYLVQHIKF